jgi:hypothetical protein
LRAQTDDAVGQDDRSGRFDSLGSILCCRDCTPETDFEKSAGFFAAELRIGAYTPALPASQTTANDNESDIADVTVPLPSSEPKSSSRAMEKPVAVYIILKS